MKRFGFNFANTASTADAMTCAPSASACSDIVCAMDTAIMVVSIFVILALALLARVGLIHVVSLLGVLVLTKIQIHNNKP